MTSSVGTSRAEPGHAQPLAVRLAAWANERFPPAQSVLFLLLYATALLYGRALVSGGELSIAASDVAAFLGVWAYFLIIRVFDEHKDYEVDLQNHPDRVLQSGRVTLGHLKVVGAVALAVQVATCLLEDGGVGRVTFWWALTFAWTLLMLKEFFVAEWLKPKLVLYAFLHLLAMPLAILWMAQIGAGDEHALPGDVVWLALFATFLAAAVEVGRKSYAPEDNRPGVDSYTRDLGTTGAATALAAMLAAAAVTAALLVDAAGVGSIGAYLAIAVALIPGARAAERFAARPDRERAKKAQAMAGITVTLLLVVLIVVAVEGRGIA